MSAHWSRNQYVMWWLDRGTGRRRCSFAAEADALKRRLAKLWHADIDAALYSPTGERIPLGAPAPKAKAKRKAKRKAKPADAPAETAAA